MCERLCRKANYLFNGLFPLAKNKQKVRTVSKTIHTCKKGPRKPRRKTEREIVQQSLFRPKFSFYPAFNVIFHTLSEVGVEKLQRETLRARWQRAVTLTVRFKPTEGSATAIFRSQFRRSKSCGNNSKTKTDKTRTWLQWRRKKEKTKKKKARKTNGDCRRRLRGVYDLFWKMVPQKAALKIQQHESYTTHTHRSKQWNSHSHNHKYTHTHVNIRTYIPARANRGEKGKR